MVEPVERARGDARGGVCRASGTRLRDAAVAAVMLAVMAALASVLLGAVMLCGVGFFLSFYSLMELIQPKRDLLVLLAPDPARDIPLMVGMMVVGAASAYGASQAFVRLPELGAWLSARWTPWLVGARPGEQQARLRQVFDRVRGGAGEGAQPRVVLPERASAGLEAREPLHVPAWHELRGR